LITDKEYEIDELELEEQNLASKMSSLDSNDPFIK
jgi:hypothetical protein